MSHVPSEAVNTGQDSARQERLYHMVRPRPNPLFAPESSAEKRLTNLSQQRRLKCDERKPTCRVCAASCRLCEGYETTLTRKPRALGSRFRRRAPVPALVETPASAEPPRPDRDGYHQLGPFQPPRSLANQVSDDPECVALFHHARTCTLQDLELALGPTDFWYRHALPLGHSVEAVKHAVCALGSAHQLFKHQSRNTGLPLDRLRDVSIWRYNRAIASVKSIMTDTATGSHMLVILTCCVTFITLENLLGRYAESLRHMKAGASLLVSLLDRDMDLGHGEPPRPAEPGHGSSCSGTSQPSLPRFFDDFAQIICRAGNDIWRYTREMIAPDLIVHSTLHDEPAGPDRSFGSVVEAERAFYAITKLIEVDRTTVSRKILAHAQYSRSSVPLHVPARYKPIPFETLKDMFNAWSERFDLFRMHCDESRMSKQDVLRTRALAVVQPLWSGWLRKCKAWRDYHQDDFEEILRRAESLVELEAFQSGPVFVFDGSLISSLAIPCVASMNPSIQWRAIQLLRSFRRREGVWDSQELADILEAMVLATSTGMVARDMLPWDVPHLARLMDSFKLDGVHIPDGPLLLIDH